MIRQYAIMFMLKPFKIEVFSPATKLYCNIARQVVWIYATSFDLP